MTFGTLSAWIGITSPVISIIGWVVTNHLSAKRERAAEIRKAKGEFRAEVISSLKGLYPHCVVDNRSIDTLLIGAFPEMQKHVEICKTRIGEADAAVLAEAWNAYRLGFEGDRGEAFLFYQYMPFGDNDPQANLRRAVDRLLSFEKQ